MAPRARNDSWPAWLVLPLFCLMTLLGAGPAWAAMEETIRVTDESSGHQEQPAVSAMVDGGFVAAWLDRSSGNAVVRAQLYDAQGNERTGEIEVANLLEGHRVAVAGLTDGKFVVVWDSWANEINLYDINARVYDAGGGAVGDIFWPGTSLNNDYLPAVDALTSGDFVVSWTTAPAGNQRTGNIMVRRYSSGGAAKSDAMQVSTEASDSMSNSAVVGLGNEEYVVLWDTVNWAVSGWNIKGRKYNNSNEPIKNFDVNTEMLNIQWYPAAARLANGRFAVAWTDVDADKQGVLRGRIFDYECNAVSGQLELSGSRPYVRAQAGLAGLNDGGFAAGWDNVNGEGKRDVITQRYDSVGSKVGEEHRFSTPGDDQINGRVVRAGDGYVLFYQSWGQDGDGWGVFGKRY